MHVIALTCNTFTLQRLDGWMDRRSCSLYAWNRRTWSVTSVRFKLSVLLAQMLIQHLGQFLPVFSESRQLPAQMVALTGCSERGNAAVWSLSNLLPFAVVPYFGRIMRNSSLGAKLLLSSEGMPIWASAGLSFGVMFCYLASDIFLKTRLCYKQTEYVLGSIGKLGWTER